MAHLLARRRPQSLRLLEQQLHHSESRYAAAVASSSWTTPARTMSHSSRRQSADPSPLQLTPSRQETETSSELNQQREGIAPPSTRRQGPLPTYEVWRKTQGRAFEETPRGRGPFWLGATPFPLNPSFAPVAPVLHEVRQAMWKQHSANPALHSIRVLSGRYGIPMERVAAILRLMALEAEFKSEGKPLQTPFQEQMERLLGSTKTKDFQRREQEALTMSANANIRGTFYEETGFTKEDEDKPSVVKAALEEENALRSERVRQMGNGGPSFKGAAVLSKTVYADGQIASSNGTGSRPPTTFVDLSSRPESYAGSGSLAQNQKRAAQRSANKARRRERRPEYARRYEVSQRILAGDRSLETMALKRELDERKVTTDAVKLAERMKKYKTKKKYKRAMKALRSTPKKNTK